MTSSMSLRIVNPEAWSTPSLVDIRTSLITHFIQGVSPTSRAATRWRDRVC